MNIARSIMSLQLDSFYIMLFARATPHDYHWALYHHREQTRGMKWHITNISDHWMSKHQSTSSATKELLLMGFVRIAHVEPERAAEVDEILTSVPYDFEGVTCRTWVLEGIRRLMYVGIVKCGNLGELESEAKAFGYAQFDDTARNVQPRPLVDSALCTM